MQKLVCFLSLVTLLSVLTVVVSAQNPPAPPTIAPSPSLVKGGKCYELRTYIAAPGKLEELHARFRNHTLKLFKKHGMEVVGFWGPTDKEKGSENTLIYVLAYPNRDRKSVV